MATKILKLSDGHVSLEFQERDILAIRTLIAALFGEATQKQFIMASVVGFGGENFTFQNEWNDPCLISGTALGDEHLQRIHEDLGNN